MKKNNSGMVYSPSDLINYMSSPFVSWMDRFALESPDQVKDIPTDQDSLLGLFAKKGNKHELEFLEQLKREHGTDNVAQIETMDPAGAREKTDKALAEGYKIIYQAYLERDQFAGYADFLFRVEGQSNLGDYHYEAWDTKLSNSVKPYFMLQLSCYSWMLESKQGRLAEEVEVVFGNKETERFRLASYYDYFLTLKQQFIQANNNFVNDIQAQPNPELYSSLGKWETYARGLMQERDSLALVANMRKTQIKRLHAAGIRSLTQLTETSETSVKGIGDPTFAKLRAQAAIQHQSEIQGKTAYKVISEDHDKGLTALPPASPLDIFFDIEGYPLMDGGLEYLWGASYRDGVASIGKHYAFKDWWAHTHEQEKTAFEGFVDWSFARWQQDPAMHIYHYASYEATALRGLALKHGTRQQQVASLLKNGVLIDLYAIVRNGLVIGEPRYSLKNVEHIYRGKRETDVAAGGDSVVYYEQWRENGGVEAWCNEQAGYSRWLSNPEVFEWATWPELKEIRDYNIDDCESTLEMVEWLRQEQKKSGITYSQPEPEVEEEQELTRQQESRIALQERQQALLEKFNQTESLKQNPVAQRIADMIQFHTREAYVAIWSYYDRLAKSEPELYEDDTAVVGIKRLSRIADNGGIVTYRGTYDDRQPIRTDKFKTGTVAGRETKIKNIQFKESDKEHEGQIELTIPAADEIPEIDQPITVFADEVQINTQTLERRICDIAEDYFDHKDIDPMLSTILNREPPRLKGTGKLPVTRSIFPENAAYDQAVVDVVQGMNRTCLCIQGPPGAGKTTTAKNVIKALVEAGMRVGIMSNSHAAIMNLLKGVCNVIPTHQVAKVGPSTINDAEFREQYPQNEYPKLYFRKDMKFPKTKMPYTDCMVVGATAFGFANDISIANPVDYLFVDEASQVVLANLVAVSRAAKNIILIGDQMQLDQPVQGAHPGDSGKSALEFMLGDHAVIPEDQGIFLERTYRMHPEVCKPLSDIVYEGKLGTAPNNHYISINIPTAKLITSTTGVLSIPVSHEGNRQSSEEEAEVVQTLISEITTGQFTDSEGVTKNLTIEDILVVAPYNMQVNLLKEKLGDAINVGTIDKFQGQEAPVVIVSLGTSDANESARGLDFVFDINRLNVAISRAKALAIIVANEGLHLCDVSTTDQMEKVNLFCRLINDGNNTVN